MKIMSLTTNTILSFFLFITLMNAQNQKYQTPQNLIDNVYKLMTFDAGTTPKWDEIKNLFHKDASIVLRASMTEMKSMNRDGFIDLWIHDMTEMKLKETGIKEEKLFERYEVMGNIAVCNVIYCVTIPTLNYPPQFGIDCFHLLKENGRWYITSIVNEALRPGVDPPENMKEEFVNYIKTLKKNSSK